MNPYREAWATVDLAALRRNATRLAAVAAPAKLCAVVKADGYGHGAVDVARAAIDGGATWLAVALVEEAVELRDARITVPILVLSEPPASAFADIVARKLVPTIYTHQGLEAARKAVVEAGSGQRLPVHVKVDTGMHRVGAEPQQAVEVALAVHRCAELQLQGMFTHLAVADEPGDPYTGQQLEIFGAVREQLEELGVRPPVLHAANSAGTLGFPSARLRLVRCGISLYGYAPAPELTPVVRLEPVMSLTARVSHAKRVLAGQRISYGLRYRFERDANVATVPLGYADGIPRALGAVGGCVLIGGKRRPIAGTVTMDQITVDCGDDPVERGDEVVLIGAQGDERITADDWARPLGTVSYEVLCGIGPRVPRVTVG